MNKTELRPELSNMEVSPFKHFFLTNFFPDTLSQDLFAWLEETNSWEYTETSFYTQYEFSLLHALDFPVTLSLLTKPSTVDFIAAQFDGNMQCGSLELVGITVHKMIDGYRMGVHNDFLGGEESHRLVVQINSGWREDNGGYLILLNSRDHSDIATLVSPLNNSAIGFEISPKSFHAVSTIYDFTRYTLVYTFK